MAARRKQRVRAAAAPMMLAATRGLRRLDVSEIEPLHEVQDEDKLADLARAMEEDGWLGRPLLVEDLGRGSGYRAWTGSHRLPAARLAGLESVPAVLVDTAKLARVLEPRRQLGVLSYVAATSDDDERLALLREAGDVKAAALMLAEVRANEA